MYHYKLTLEEVGNLTPYQVSVMASTAYKMLGGKTQDSGYTEATDGELNPQKIAEFNKSMGIKNE